MALRSHQGLVPQIASWEIRPAPRGALRLSYRATDDHGARPRRFARSPDRAAPAPVPELGQGERQGRRQARRRSPLASAADAAAIAEVNVKQVEGKASQDPTAHPGGLKVRMMPRRARPRRQTGLSESYEFISLREFHQARQSRGRAAQPVREQDR
jgi:hypothetical protein